MSRQSICLLGLCIAGAFLTGGSAVQAKYKVLHSFGGSDGVYPFASLVADNKGSLYGTTYYGGVLDNGVVFKVDTASGSVSTVYVFNGGLDGARPEGSVLLDNSGNLYGTTDDGGYGRHGGGTLYRIGADGTESVLHAFRHKGTSPRSGLVTDEKGNLYGTTNEGGASSFGTAFKFTPAGKEISLHDFSDGDDGGRPIAGMVRDALGNLYGTTAYGGAFGSGTVFKLVPDGTETVLHSFDSTEGSPAFVTLIMDTDGNLYGTTGGNSPEGICGTVFKLAPDGTETILYAFAGHGDGCVPISGVIADAHRNLYGTTGSGGAYGEGTVFKLSRDGSETILHSFRGKRGDGSSPYGSLVRDKDGNLFGTTVGGGDYGRGTVFEISH
jgi:uncharacterized repeat protein (TIGR03803 family)